MIKFTVHYDVNATFSKLIFSFLFMSFFRRLSPVPLVRDLLRKLGSLSRDDGFCDILKWKMYCIPVHFFFNFNYFDCINAFIFLSILHMELNQFV